MPRIASGPRLADTKPKTPGGGFWTPKGTYFDPRWSLLNRPVTARRVMSAGGCDAGLERSYSATWRKMSPTAAEVARQLARHRDAKHPRRRDTKTDTEELRFPALAGLQPPRNGHQNGHQMLGNVLPVFTSRTHNYLHMRGHLRDFLRDGEQSSPRNHVCAKLVRADHCSPFPASTLGAEDCSALFTISRASSTILLR